jgi:pyrimidine operon attenuation protein/uracil phosphoribosyltransferase
MVMNAMAKQAAALLHGCTKVAIIGVLRRGAPLADRLTELLVEQHQFPKPMRLDLSVKRYADDLTLLYPETQLNESKQIATVDLSGYALLIVDDVLFTGHSILRVVEYFSKKNPAQIRVACLADRKVVTLPIKADIVGVDLQIAPEDVIECHVPPYEPTFEINLLRLPLKNNS